MVCDCVSMLARCKVETRGKRTGVFFFKMSKGREATCYSQQSNAVPLPGLHCSNIKMISREPEVLSLEVT